MRRVQSLASLVTGAASAAFCVGIVLIAPDLVHAQGKSQGSTCTCPLSPEPDVTRPSPRPRFADVRPGTASGEHTTALEAVHVALTEVGDGSAYVWHHGQGALSGIVTPTASFRDPAGNVCRHIVVEMTRGSYSRRIEGVACRLEGGRWQLEG